MVMIASLWELHCDLFCFTAVVVVGVTVIRMESCDRVCDWVSEWEEEEEDEVVWCHWLIVLTRNGRLLAPGLHVSCHHQRRRGRRYNWAREEQLHLATFKGNNSINVFLLFAIGILRHILFVCALCKQQNRSIIKVIKEKKSLSPTQQSESEVTGGDFPSRS